MLIPVEEVYTMQCDFDILYNDEGPSRRDRLREMWLCESQKGNKRDKRAENERGLSKRYDVNAA